MLPFNAVQSVLQKKIIKKMCRIVDHAHTHKNGLLSNRIKHIIRLNASLSITSTVFAADVSEFPSLVFVYVFIWLGIFRKMLKTYVLSDFGL